MVSTHRTILVGAMSAALMALSPAVASASPVQLDGSFSVTMTKPDFTGISCSTGNECGTLQLATFGAADFAYAYGPTFDPTGTKGCFTVDGTLTITLESDGSSLSGPLTGVYCNPGNSYEGQHGTPSYGHPFHEDDTVTLARGTGQFAGLSGTAAFHTFSAGAAFRGTLTGTLSG